MNINDGRFFQGKFGGEQQRSEFKHTENFSKTTGEMAGTALVFVAAAVLCVVKGLEIFYPKKNNKGNNMKRR